jgi:hypothetical protein
MFCAACYPTHHRSPGAISDGWILALGAWSDAGTWIDTDTWKDS